MASIFEKDEKVLAQNLPAKKVDVIKPELIRNSLNCYADTTSVESTTLQHQLTDKQLTPNAIVSANKLQQSTTGMMMTDGQKPSFVINTVIFCFAFLINKNYFILFFSIFLYISLFFSNFFDLSSSLLFFKIKFVVDLELFFFFVFYNNKVSSPSTRLGTFFNRVYLNQ